jgi:hypothetical protein
MQHVFCFVLFCVLLGRCLEKPALGLHALTLLEKCRAARQQPVWIPTREAGQREPGVSFLYICQFGLRFTYVTPVLVKILMMETPG